MCPSLEELVLHYFFKEVKITLTSGAKFGGFLVGIKLPAGEIVMLHLVEKKNVEKYTKSLNTRWLFSLPYELIREITLVENASQETEDTLLVSVLKSQEK